MARFVAKTIAVDNSDLYQLDNYQPIWSSTLASIGYESVYDNGKLTVKVFTEGTFHYKLVDEVSKKQAKTLFVGDDWESRFFKGADSIKGSSDGDALYGFNGGDAVYGRGGDDIIYGGSGKDALYGGAGVNTLYGGKGKDAFVFDAALKQGNNGHVGDFGGKDEIHLARSAFEGIGPKGALKGAKFILADDYTGQKKAVIYDKDIGSLSYSKAGGDIGNAVAFGSVTAGLALDHKDFLIV